MRCAANIFYVLFSLIRVGGGRIGFSVGTFGQQTICNLSWKPHTVGDNESFTTSSMTDGQSCSKRHVPARPVRSMTHASFSFSAGANCTNANMKIATQMLSKKNLCIFLNKMCKYRRVFGTLRPNVNIRAQCQQNEREKKKKQNQKTKQE